MFVCCECCVLSGRGLCDELITRPEESYRLWWVVMCDLETSRMRRPWPALGRSATARKWKQTEHSNRSKRVVSFTPRLLYPWRKSSPHHLNTAMGRLRSMCLARNLLELLDTWRRRHYSQSKRQEEHTQYHSAISENTLTFQIHRLY